MTSRRYENHAAHGQIGAAVHTTQDTINGKGCNAIETLMCHKVMSMSAKGLRCHK